MIFQLEAILIGALITLIVIALVMFLIGVKVTQWYATKKGWDSTFKTAAIVNLVWLIVDIPMGLILVYAFGGGLGFDVLRVVILIIVGSFIAMKIYNKEFGEAFGFVLVIQIILFVISIILGVIIGVILGMVLISMLF